jgi:hypothetical protein
MPVYVVVPLSPYASRSCLGLQDVEVSEAVVIRGGLLGTSRLSRSWIPHCPRPVITCGRCLSGIRRAPPGTDPRRVCPFPLRGCSSPGSFVPGTRVPYRPEHSLMHPCSGPVSRRCFACRGILHRWSAGVGGVGKGMGRGGGVMVFGCGWEGGGVGGGTPCPNAAGVPELGNSEEPWPCVGSEGLGAWGLIRLPVSGYRTDGCVVTEC